MGEASDTKQARATGDKSTPKKPDPEVAAGRSGPRGNIQSKNAYKVPGRRYPSLRKHRLVVDQFSGRTYRVGGRARPNKPRAQRTAIDADLAEVADYRDLLRKGEVGLAGPNGANVGGPDSITYDPKTDRIYVNDSQTFWTDEPRTVKDTEPKRSWKNEAKRAAENVDIDDIQLAKKIRAAAEKPIIRRNHTPRRVPPPVVPDEFIDIGADIDPDNTDSDSSKKRKGAVERKVPNDPKNVHGKAKGKGKSRKTQPTRATSQRLSGNTPTPRTTQKPTTSPHLKKGAVSTAGPLDPSEIKVGRGTFKFAKGMMKGLVIGLIQEWALGKIIGPYEQQLDRINYAIASTLFSQILIPKVQDKLDEHYAAMFSVFSDPNTYPWPKQTKYLCLSWKIVNRIEMDASLGNIAIWIYRFPEGFSETIVRAELAPEFGVANSPLWYWNHREPYPADAQKVREFKEKSSTHKEYTYVTSFLIWDPVVARLAREILDKGVSHRSFTTISQFTFHQRFLLTVLAGDVFYKMLVKYGIDMTGWVSGRVGKLLR